jgi:hypothetical protein
MPTAMLTPVAIGTINPVCVSRRRAESVWSKPMPSFDIMSEVDQVELRNAIDQANKEIANRFDFKGSDARV